MSEALSAKAAILARVEATLGPVRRVGADALLPSGTRLVVCWSKAHHQGRDFFIGLPNRLRPEDALIVGLGGMDIVFPEAEWLLQYSSRFSHSNDGRPNPRFRLLDGQPVLGIRGSSPRDVSHLLGDYESLRGNRPRTRLTADLFVPHRPFAPPTIVDSSERKPVRVDPVQVDRAVRAHAHTLTSLATHLAGHGIQAFEWTVPQPMFDLAWCWGSKNFVCETKSITTRNEERQLRLGLGQVLRYRHALGPHGQWVAVLCVERRPLDATWLDLCSSLDVILTWPAVFDALPGCDLVRPPFVGHRPTP